MVAAWMSADTGVGPAIASRSQDCSGTCADLPQAARSRRRPIHVIVLLGADEDASATPAIVTVPNVANMTMIAMDSPTSPTRLTMKASWAALAYSGRWFQKPRSRYDARPTPSQPTYSVR